MGLLFTSTTNKSTATHIIVNGQYCPAVNAHVMGRQIQYNKGYCADTSPRFAVSLVVGNVRSKVVAD